MCIGRFAIRTRNKRRTKNESAQANPVRDCLRCIPRAVRRLLLNHREQLLIADHHNRYDFTQIDVFFAVLLIVCVGVGILVKNLLNDEENG